MHLRLQFREVSPEKENGTWTQLIFLKAQDLSSVPISGFAQDSQIAQGCNILRCRKLL